MKKDQEIIEKKERKRTGFSPSEKKKRIKVRWVVVLLGVDLGWVRVSGWWCVTLLFSVECQIYINGLVNLYFKV